MKHLQVIFEYFNFQRLIAKSSIESMYIIFYATVLLVILLNVFFVFGLVFNQVHWIEKVNRKVIG